MKKNPNQNNNKAKQTNNKNNTKPHTQTNKPTPRTKTNKPKPAQLVSINFSSENKVTIKGDQIISLRANDIFIVFSLDTSA